MNTESVHTVSQRNFSFGFPVSLVSELIFQF